MFTPDMIAAQFMEKFKTFQDDPTPTPTFTQEQLVGFNSLLQSDPAELIAFLAAVTMLVKLHMTMEGEEPDMIMEALIQLTNVFNGLTIPLAHTYYTLHNIQTQKNTPPLEDVFKNLDFDMPNVDVT